MATFDVENIPDEMHSRLKQLAKERRTTVNAIVLNALERELRSAEWRERWQLRPETELGIDGATLVREARAEAGPE